MSYWPKKMWLNEQQTAAFTGPLSGGIKCGTEVLVYPADQAPKPVAWLGPIGQLMLDQIYRDWCATYPDQPGPKLWKPLYLAPPSESADIDRLRAENATLRENYLAVVAESSWVLAERDNLRELVREVYDNADVGWLGTSWDERAEKALSFTPAPAPR